MPVLIRRSSLNRGTSWTYNYDGDEANTNRVDDIDGRTPDDNWDYDESGRQTKDDYTGFDSATYHFPGAAFHDITMSGGTLQMRYGKDNRRLQKKNTANEGVTTDYIRDLGGRVLAVFVDNTLVERYVWGPYGLVAIVKGTNSSPTTYYTLNDHLGYVRTVVSTAGTAVAAYDYYPYGKDLRSSVDSEAGSRFRFGAKEYDTDLTLNLYYFEARFYNPDIGRFVAPDPARVGWSYYCFANNNPLRLIDPTGLYWLYSIYSGSLYWFSNDGDCCSWYGVGYSGRDGGLNNPNMQSGPGSYKIGPIPTGMWEIGPRRDGPTKSCFFDLDYLGGELPDPRTPGFQIHGGPDDGGVSGASHGCIVLPLWIRELIAESGDTLLIVEGW